MNQQPPFQKTQRTPPKSKRICDFHSGLLHAALTPIRWITQLKSAIFILTTFAAMITLFAGVSIAQFWIFASPEYLHLIPQGLSVNEFGDSFGFANALFSALAFAGVIVTLILQIIELKAQRLEVIEMQRGQMLQAHISALTLKANAGDEDAEFEANFLADLLQNEAKDYLRKNQDQHRFFTTITFTRRLNRLHNRIVKIIDVSEVETYKKISKDCRDLCFFLSQIVSGKNTGFSTEEAIAVSSISQIFLQISNVMPVVDFYGKIDVSYLKKRRIMEAISMTLVSCLLPLHTVTPISPGLIDIQMIYKLISETEEKLKLFPESMDAKVRSILAEPSLPDI